MSAVSTAVLNRIHHGDCIAGMNKLPEGSIDLAFADPPFNIGYKYDVYEDVKEHQHYLDWSRDWISAVHRVLKPTGTFWLAIGDEYAAELKLLSQEIGFHTRSWVIWYYTFGVNCKYKFSRTSQRIASRQQGNWSTTISEPTRKAVWPTTRGFCVRKISLIA